MNEIELSKVERLRELHSEIMGGMRKTIAQAIEAGGILSEIKEALPHGSFTQWIEDNTGFDIRTAQNYMRTYANREKLKSESVSHLTEAYRLLEDKREMATEDPAPPQITKALPLEWYDSDGLIPRIYPDTEIARIGINSEILRIRHEAMKVDDAIYEAKEEHIVEEVQAYLGDLTLWLDDVNYFMIHNTRALMNGEILAGETSHLENRATVIQESAEWLNERNDWREANGYKRLPIDELVPLADSRIKTIV